MLTVFIFMSSCLIIIELLKKKKNIQNSILAKDSTDLDSPDEYFQDLDSSDEYSQNEDSSDEDSQNEDSSDDDSQNEDSSDEDSTNEDSTDEDIIDNGASEIIIKQNKSYIGLCIGINYPNSSSPLSGCIQDTEYISTKFLKLYPEIDMKIMTDNLTLSNNCYPTRNNILFQLKQFVKRLLSKTGEVFGVFQFAGHGIFYTDYSNDEIDGKDECIIAADNLILGDDLLHDIIVTPLKDSSNITLLIVMDCCHSGTMLDLPYIYNTDNATWEHCTTKVHEDIKATIIVYSGCKDSQTSADAFISGVAQGAMSWSWQRATQVDNQTIFETLENMRILLKNNHYQQIPQLTCSQPLHYNFLVYP